MAGVQEKVLLTSTDDGWAWPEDGAPSSHIIKPEPLSGVIRGLVQWELLRQVTFNACLGNADAHSKNYSLLLGRDGTVELAPLYDTAPIRLMDPRFQGSGMVVGGRTRLDAIDRQALLDEASAWGLRTERAARVVDETVAAVREAAHSVPVPDDQPVLRQMDERWDRWR